MPLELITSTPSVDVHPWTHSTVPTEHSLFGFHSVSAALEGFERTAKLLTDTASCLESLPTHLDSPKTKNWRCWAIT